MKRPPCRRPDDPDPMPSARHCCRYIVQTRHTACYARHVGGNRKAMKGECSTGIAVSLLPTKHDAADGISRAPAKHAEQNLQTTHRQPSFSSPSTAKETEQPRLPDLLTSGCSQLRVPCPRTPVACTSTPGASASEAAAAVALGPFVTAPLAIHNHKAIFGWAANLFLAAATSQTTTAEKSGPTRLGDPVPGRGDVEGRRFAAHPQPLLPAAHIPHPTVGPGLLCPAWCGCPAWFAQPQPTPPGPCSSVFIYLLHPPLPARLCLTSIFFSPILSLSTFLTTPQ